MFKEIWYRLCYRKQICPLTNELEHWIEWVTTLNHFVLTLNVTLY